MEISVNGNQLNQDYINTEKSLEDVLCTLSEQAVPDDHIIGDVTVDGTLFSERYPGESRYITAASIRRLEINTVSVEQLAMAALKDGSVFIDRIIDSINHAAELFRMHDEYEAQSYYCKLIDALRAFFNFIAATKKAIKWDFHAAHYNNAPVQKEWDSLVTVIDQLQSVQEEGDLILIADILEYELLPAMKRWSEIFKNKSLQ